MKKKISLWTVVGFTFVSVAGTLLHFLFEWSGEPVWLAPFCAVNESIYEHMKLLYFPMLLFFFIEARFREDRSDAISLSYLCASVSGILLIPVSYYTYTGALGVFSDAVNIGIFYVCVLFSFFVLRYLESRLKVAFVRTATVLFVLIGLIFAFLTFFPIRIPLFEDPITGEYGILP